MHRMNMAQLQDALQNTPALVEKHGLQFEDGNRLITIPPEFSYVLACAISAALTEMIFEAELSKNN